MKVCIVDDDELLRAALAAGLRARGHEVVEAGSGRSGIEAIAAEGAEVAIIDILMPDMDGIEVLAELSRRLPHVRTIVMSGGGRLQGGFYLEAAQGLGAQSVLSKPIDLDMLSAIIEGKNGTG